jgi:tetratricopeptide (TPR) repeat protein
MKRSERHHLKENELAISLRKARTVAEQHRREITLATIVVLVAIAAGVGYLVWHQRTATQAEDRLAEALTVAESPVVPPPPAGTPPPPATPGSFASEQARLTAALPKFLAAADAYPATAAGIAARYHAATTLTALGRYAEALTRYDEVIARAGDGVYGQMARLGKADALVLSGQHEAGIAIYQELSARKDSNLPVDAILMQLAKSYAAAGKITEARATFNRIVDQYPDSPYAAEARQQVQTLASGAPAA